MKNRRLFSVTVRHDCNNTPEPLRTGLLAGGGTFPGATLPLLLRRRPHPRRAASSKVILAIKLWVTNKGVGSRPPR